MVLTLDGNSEHIAHPWRKTDPSSNDFKFFDCCRSKPIPYTDQIREIAPYAPAIDLPSDISTIIYEDFFCMNILGFSWLLNRTKALLCIFDDLRH